METSHARTARPRLPQGILGQIRMVLFQPEQFFKRLAGQRSAWLIAAVLLMLLTGLSEVQRQQRLAAPDASGGGFSEMPVPMDGMPMGDPMIGDPGMGGGVPLPPSDGGSPSTPSVPLTQQIEQVLGAGGSILVFWVLLMPLLALVTLFTGRAPRLSQVLQTAVWATVPLGVLALVQLVYYQAGGRAGEPGLAGLVDELPFFAELDSIQQRLMLSLMARVTLFHGWMVVLVYLGARHNLRGRRLVVIPVIIAWIALVVMLPVALQPAPAATGDAAITDLREGEMPPMGEEGIPANMGGDEMPFDDLSGEQAPLSETESPLDEGLEDVAPSEGVR